MAPRPARCRPESHFKQQGAADCSAPCARFYRMSNELASLGALAVACLFAAAILFRAWLRRRSRPALIAAVLVLVLGAGAVVVVLLGVPYRSVVGPAFIVAILAILVSARIDRRNP